MSVYGAGKFNIVSGESASTETERTRPRVVFFGSGPVAAESLRLLTAWCDVEAVVTKPQPAHHKQPFPVLVVAEELGLKVYTPNGRTALSELIISKPFTSPLGIVIDYGFIINQDVIDYFPLGIVNSHFSLLPEWRGADPITFAILSGQKETGVSNMLIVAKMDEGPLLGFGLYDISPDETTPTLTDNLIQLSDALLQHDIPEYLENGKTISQEEIGEMFGQEPSYSRKLTKEDGLLDFTKPALQLEREVRAYLEWPKSRTTLAGKEVVITKAHVAEVTKPSHKLGDAFAYGKELHIQTSEGVLAVDALKPAGKAEMPAAAFLAGYGKNL